MLSGKAVVDWAAVRGVAPGMTTLTATASDGFISHSARESLTVVASDSPVANVLGSAEGSRRISLLTP